ncbi:hypothetical protein [Persicobacter diffluens]|uniref:Uncharacterized protein n=1 Tax=Persicobacter diffluens TaxID=981 RepID=A0AAN4W2W4_9BACT|nr:hypothetical protein PEDI_35420 [Persicobacter diffluens]
MKYKAFSNRLVSDAPTSDKSIVQDPLPQWSSSVDSRFSSIEYVLIEENIEFQHLKSCSDFIKKLPASTFSIAVDLSAMGRFEGGLALLHLKEIDADTVEQKVGNNMEVPNFSAQFSDYLQWMELSNEMHYEEYSTMYFQQLAALLYTARAENCNRVIMLFRHKSNHLVADSFIDFYRLFKPYDTPVVNQIKRVRRMSDDVEIFLGWIE